MAALWGRKEEEESSSAVSSLFLPLSLFVTTSRLSALAVQSEVLRPRLFSLSKTRLYILRFGWLVFGMTSGRCFTRSPRRSF